MGSPGFSSKTLKLIGLWGAVAALFLLVDHLLPETAVLPSGMSLFELAGLIAGICGLAEVFAFATHQFLAHRNRPPVESAMIGRQYRLASILAALLVITYGLGRLETLGTGLAALGGMFLGWSLQAPVSGFAAWVLVSLKRPFRPGDRIQLPNLGLVGDVKDIGAMYTVLDQVGGSIGSEEAVGRHVLVPNAMLFSQVVINYTVAQDAAYMLDEVVVRITYDSDWKVAEKILLDAAIDVTRPIVEATGVKPYIRSDLYDYGVYLRLRYQTYAKDRTQIASEINKRIFNDFQRTPSVDLAIPYIYSYRAGADRKEQDLPTDKDAAFVESIEVAHVREPGPFDEKEIEALARSIERKGLLQPIVVSRGPDGEPFEILAGDKRFAACKRLGWKLIPAVVRGHTSNVNV